ncbi:WD repeat domain 54-like isoform X2 [Vicugna pacos]|uniref:WD repeat domain 54-like isoform X2 n=1 Tax=Vicugna pacos TaxID=30538 RepID=A0ABM5BB64_VICPA
MFRRERSIPLRGSAAALCNHLSVLQRPVRNLTHFGVVHGPGAQLLSAAPEGVPLAQRQLHAKEGAGVSSPLITQMYKCDGSVMVYWHALDSGGASCGTEWGLAVRLEPRSSRPAGACSSQNCSSKAQCFYLVPPGACRQHHRTQATLL